MKFSKEQILAELRKAAAANNGVPPGYRAFTRATGIRQTDILGVYWIRWNDVLKEAGFETREKNLSIDENVVLEKMALFIREIGQYPLVVHFRMKSREGVGFPDQKTFSKKFGTKSEIVSKVIEWCESRAGFDDVAGLCRGILEDMVPKEHQEADAPGDVGYVYLMKSGKRYKIGKTESLEKRFTGLSAQVPHELIQVHAISTDDPSGIEAYWHRRFKDRPRHNEWFELSAEDVAAFKRRKFM